MSIPCPFCGASFEGESTQRVFECPSCGNKIGVADLLKPGTFSKRLTMGVGAEYVPEQGIPCEISPQQARANALQLVRQYPDRFRADAVGLKAGSYTMKIVPVFHGKTGGGYLTQFYPPVGDVTYLAITQDKDGHFKFVVAEGVNEPGPIFTFGDTNMRTRFTCGAREFCNRWSEAGPTHHMAAATGRHIDTILKVAKIFDVPVDIITR